MPAFWFSAAASGNENGIFSRLAADLDTSISSADSATSSPIRAVSKSKTRRVKILSSSSSEDSSSNSSEEEIEVSKKISDSKKRKNRKPGDNKCHGKEVGTVEMPKVCFNCPKQAVRSTLWCSDGHYCSVSCCVLYSKKCFNDWVAERKRKAEMQREQNEIEALKHAKDFFCIETEDDEPCEEAAPACKSEPGQFLPHNGVK